MKREDRDAGGRMRADRPEPATCDLPSALDELLADARDSAKGSHVIRAVDVRKVYRMGESETHALRGMHEHAA